ncbi:MAG: hydrolase [Phycisphaerae bacterium]|nr:MAG: hydrolase [Phycisphaerae bacterium]
MIPSRRIYSDEHCTAFLDIAPLAPGHTLVVPRQHVTNLLDCSADALAAVTRALPRLATALVAATGATGLNLLQNSGASSGQVVMHLHFHLIPRRDGDGLGYRWNAGSYAPGEAESLQDLLIKQLQS